MAVRGQVPRLSQLMAQVPTPPQKAETARAASSRGQGGYKAAVQDAIASGVAGNRMESFQGGSGGNWGDGDDIIAGDWAGMRKGVNERERTVVLGRRGVEAMDFEGMKIWGAADARLQGASVLELLNWEGKAEAFEVEDREARSGWRAGARGPLGMRSGDEIFIGGESAQDGRLAELRCLTIKSLRALCRQHGLILKGTKEELVLRISQHEQRTGQASILKPGSTAADLFNCLSWELPAEVAL
ncbi:unnamed protein product [Ostreobium quekettii]|uniref:SAP domain-containing protein n=1 Tax=Ostreobium quekettii TaxID=121088 RepID=A0A8S1IYJ2_9CHLO|nr:unnamed protein product [Ostreobium quekettii]|eukprot:evm.model.scf_907.4 EVM.evm.TU.scf_907.4   scf_907:26704-28149(+)